MMNNKIKDVSRKFFRRGRPKEKTSHGYRRL